MQKLSSITFSHNKRYYSDDSWNEIERVVSFFQKKATTVTSPKCQLSNEKRKLTLSLEVVEWRWGRIIEYFLKITKNYFFYIFLHVLSVYYAKTKIYKNTLNKHSVAYRSYLL
jgi:hypothetical protein